MNCLTRLVRGPERGRIVAFISVALLIVLAAVTAGAGELRGRLLPGPGGESPSGATVIVTYLESGLTRAVVAGEDGSFQVEDLPEGIVSVMAKAPGDAGSLPLAARSVKIPARGTAEITLSGAAGPALAPTFNFLLYKGEYYNNKPDRTAADPVTVTGTATTANINIGMTTGGGTMSGRVTADAGGAGIPGVVVFAFGRSSFVISFDRTDASGNYKITGVPADSFLVVVNSLFVDPDNDYIGEYYDNTTNILSARSVRVNEGQDTPNINFGLALGGSISGKVTAAAGGRELASATVYATTTAPGFSIPFTTLTDQSGNYRFRGLPAGTYKVEAEYEGNFLPQYYNNKPTQATADPVTVAANQNTSGINFALAAGGIIQGTVRDSTTQAVIVDELVVAENTADVTASYTAFTDQSGLYRIEGLPTGTYKVSVPFMNKWYNNKFSSDAADPVSVTAGAAVSNINFTGTIGGGCSSDPSEVATITGRVTAASGGAAIPDADVDLYMSMEGFRFHFGSTQTDNNGNYRFDCLNPGAYVVECSAPYTDFLAQWFENADSATATVLNLTPGQVRNNVNFALSRGGKIAGRVTVEGTSDAIAGVEVNAVNTVTNEEASAFSGSDGTYTISEGSEGGLRPGSYKVWVLDKSTANLGLVPVTLSRFEARPVDGGIQLDWRTADGSDAAVFHVYRAESPSGEAGRITEQALAGGPDFGYTDNSAVSGRTYWYWLGAIDRSGGESRLGPVAARFGEVSMTRLVGVMPNPFKAAASIRFSLATRSPVSLRVFDASGRLVRTLADATYPAGAATIQWDGRNDSGSQAPAGVYYLSLVTNQGTFNSKVAVVR